MTYGLALDRVPSRHVYPVFDDGSPKHKLDGFCWCQPLVEHTLDGDLYIHRRSLDSPHIELEQ